MASYHTWFRLEEKFTVLTEINKIIDKHLASLNEDLKSLGGYTILITLPNRSGFSVTLGKPWKEIRKNAEIQQEDYANYEISRTKTRIR